MECSKRDTCVNRDSKCYECKAMSDIYNHYPCYAVGTRTTWVMYGNDGSIDDVIELLKHPEKTFKTVKDMFDYLVETRESISNIRDLFMSYYGRDPRLQKDVYIIGTAKSGNEDYMRKYHWPQFVSYAVEVEL